MSETLTIGKDNKMETIETEKRYFGTVIFFSTVLNYGFLEWFAENGEKNIDLFVHFSGILMPGFKFLKKDQKVSFTIGKNKRGEDIAVDVVVEQDA